MRKKLIFAVNWVKKLVTIFRKNPKKHVHTFIYRPPNYPGSLAMDTSKTCVKMIRCPPVIYNPDYISILKQALQNESNVDVR